MTIQNDAQMFCFQCEQAKNNVGCTIESTCGKSPEVAALQDLLVHALKGLALVAVEAERHGVHDDAVDEFTPVALFATLTNTNFDAERFHELIPQVVGHRERLQAKLAEAGVEADFDSGPATFEPADAPAALEAQGRLVGLLGPSSPDPDYQSLRETLIYGMKGLAAYAHHAHELGYTDPRLPAFLHEALAASTRDDLTTEEWLTLILRCGEVNLWTMELLDRAHCETFGSPEPTSVSLGQRAGKAILVSGHDLADLRALLEQTEGKGISVYTHGEMLPAHGYPGLKRYPHLAGHYGGAWQDQVREFNRFPGPIVMTTNCIVKPRDSYLDRIYTLGAVGWPGAKHVAERDFSEVVEQALAMDGFADDVEGESVMVGFGHDAVMSVADTVVGAVKSGAIRHFFLVGGCDGARPGRNYYTELVEKIPEDCMVLTLACGKFRFFDKKLGEIGGLPRLLDVGQCNDAYSAIKIAEALAGAFECGVNELPLTFALSWFEQKAVAVLLTLLHLGVKGIKLGPTLPAFLTPNVLQVLVDTYEIAPISTPDEDLAAALA